MAYGYCVKCKDTVNAQNMRQITMKNGKPAQQGDCPTCGTHVTLMNAPQTHD